MNLFSVFGNPSTWESLQGKSLPPVNRTVLTGLFWQLGHRCVTSWTQPGSQSRGSIREEAPCRVLSLQQEGWVFPQILLFQPILSVLYSSDLGFCFVVLDHFPLTLTHFCANISQIFVSTPEFSLYIYILLPIYYLHLKWTSPCISNFYYFFKFIDIY